MISLFSFPHLDYKLGYNKNCVLIIMNPQLSRINLIHGRVSLNAGVKTLPCELSSYMYMYVHIHTPNGIVSLPLELIYKVHLCLTFSPFFKKKTHPSPTEYQLT